MGFDFSPSFWFVCRSCRNSFASTETLKEHKLAWHLEECMGIKCIIFEERFMTEEWNPEHNICENEERKSKAFKNEKSVHSGRNIVPIDDDSTRESLCKNPYVSLTRITNKEIFSWNKNSSSHDRQDKKPSKRKGPLRSSFKANGTDRKSELSMQKLRRTDHGHEDYDTTSKLLNCAFIDPQSFSSKESIRFEQEIQLKEESTIDDLSIPINSDVDEAAFPNLQDVKDEEFMDASVSLNFDGVSRVQFTSTLIPASPEYQPYQEQHQMNSHEATSSKADATFTPSEHQEYLFNNEANDINTSVTTELKIKIDTYDSDLSDPTLAEEIQEPEQELSESIEPHQSTSLANCQSTNATDANVEKPFMCETCFTSFRKKELLKQHMVRHSSTKPFKCSKCPSRFKRQGELARHQIVHGMKTNYKCRFCSRCFIHNQNLVAHERSHTGDRPYKCPVARCDYAASSKGVLARHARALHCEELGLQQFVCPTCGKTFGLKYRLDFHIRSHHNDTKPFQCTHRRCTKKFKSEQYLKRHLGCMHKVFLL